MKKFCLLLLLIVLYAPTTLAQSISVASFKLLDTDMTANTAGTIEKDQNGEIAALLKVVTTQTGFSFDCGSMGIVKTLQKPSEIWVYVPRGVKKITISHPQLGLLRDYFFPISIDAARTYEMVLTTGTVQTIVQQTSNSQYLVLKVKPANAIVEVNNELLPTSDGIAQKFVKLGTYEYRVQAPDYHLAVGKVDVNDPNNKTVVEINLDPAFGWIEIPENQEYNGAQVFIDNALAGTIPMKSKNLSSGEHSIKVVKPLYNSYSQTVVVKDNETTQVTPTLSANFSEVTISVDNDAEIYVNDENKGKGSWAGKLAYGNYKLEAKKMSHRSTMQNIEITQGQPNNHFHLTSPTPIYGGAKITSTPSISEVYIDEKHYGQTPLYLPSLLTGTHKITIKHKGYSDYIGNVNILEGQTSSIVADLKNTIVAKVETNAPAAIIYIDGNRIGEGNVEHPVTIGKHAIEVIDTTFTHNNYKSTYDFSLINNYVNINLKNKKADVVFSYIPPKPNRNEYIYISIDGDYFYPFGDKIKNDYRTTLDCGPHEIVIRHEGIPKIKQTINVNSKQTNFVISFKERTIKQY